MKMTNYSPLLALFVLASISSPIYASLGSVRPWTSVSLPNHKRYDVPGRKTSNNNNNRKGWRGQNLGTTTTTTTSELDTEHDELDEITRQKINAILKANPPRGGQSKDVDGVVQIVGSVTRGVISFGRAALPPTVAVGKAVVNFYRALPIDAVVVQIGLVYCFAGGYYPTLFSSLQAASQCGWQIMLEAVNDLTEEAIKVVDAIEASSYSLPPKEIFMYKADIILRTVDPEKINRAIAALYTTWLGVAAVLEQEYARTISLAMTLSHCFEKATHWILEPPVRMCVSEDYHKWIPVIIGWACKGMAMNIAWRIQRVLTAATSAMTGGLMVARACFRMLAKRDIRLFGLIPENAAFESTFLDEVIGFLVAGIGFYTQIDAQYKNAFSFKVPFPISLITWPFDWAEKWIQWYITR